MLELYVCTAYKTVEQGLLAYKRLARDKRKKRKKHLIAIYTTQTRDLELSIKDFPWVKICLPI